MHTSERGRVCVCVCGGGGGGCVCACAARDIVSSFIRSQMAWAESSFSDCIAILNAYVVGHELCMM